MPIYPYQCEVCQRDWEDIRSISDPTIPFCPACGSAKVAQLMPWRFSLVTDREYMQGRGDLETQLGDDVRRVVRAARRHGYKPSRHDTYEPGLARFPGDPEAFVPHDSPRGYVQRLCAKRGISADGRGIKIKGTPRLTEKPPVKIAPAVVADRMRVAVMDNPDLAHSPKKLKELRNEIIQRQGKKD